MAPNPENESTDAEANRKRNKAKLQQAQRRERKHRNTRLELYKYFAATCGVIGAAFPLLDILGLNAKWIAIGRTAFIFFSVLLGAFALRLSIIINHTATANAKVKATRWFWIIVTPSFILCAGLGYRFAVTEPEIANLLIPANEPIPEMFGAGKPDEKLGLSLRHVTVEKGEMVVFLGPFAVSTPQQSFTVLRLYDKDVLKIFKSKNGISVTADIWSPDGKIMADIVSNKFHVNINNTAYSERPDPHTLIVKDEKKVTVLSVRYLNPDTVKITGVFRGDGKYPVIISDDLMIYGPFHQGKSIALHLGGKVLFDWPSSLPPERYNRRHTNAMTMETIGSELTSVWHDEKGRRWIGPRLGGSNEVMVGDIMFMGVD
jgi:hypothetical protein